MSTSNFKNIYISINTEINKQNLARQENNKYYINDNNFDAILLLVFNISTKNECSFSILREKYEECQVILFDNNSSNIKKLKLIYKNKDNNLLYILKSKFYKIKYNILKNIKIIPIIGPDGVGKTTLFLESRKQIKNKTIYKKFKKIVRRSILYNIFYPLTRIMLKKKLGKKLEKDQHDDKNPILIILSGLIYYPYLVFITLIQKKVIFIDRFFYDYLLENISFINKTTHLRKNWKLFLILIPYTFWHIQLDAKNKIIIHRKDELNSNDIDKYRELNFQIYLKKPSINYSYINTGNSIENCKNILLSIGKDIKILN